MKKAKQPHEDPDTAERKAARAEVEKVWKRVNRRVLPPYFAALAAEFGILQP
jgi:hypothetical protein